MSSPTSRTDRAQAEVAGRKRLYNEIHARPPQPLEAPAQITHLALLASNAEAEADAERLNTLADGVHQPGPAPQARHAMLDGGVWRLRWERHAEFLSYTIVRPGPTDTPFSDTALDAFPQDFVAQTPGRLLLGVHVSVANADRAYLNKDDIQKALGQNDYLVSTFKGGGLTAASAFRLHGDDFARILVYNHSCGPTELGRAVQWLLEVETYRMMALLALPVAHQVGAAVSKLEANVNDITKKLAATHSEAEDRALLDRLIQASAQAEDEATDSSFRFSAARAYYAIVRERIAALREERQKGRESLGGFLDRRLAPAMNTCDATAQRQQAVIDRLSRVTDLLRTRVDMALQQQNAKMLASVDKRAKMQLRLQQTVEGLSVVAISYYAVGLAGYVFKALEHAVSAFDATLATGLSAPAIVLGVAWTLRRARKALTDSDPPAVQE
ncbi:MAG: DUF3422 family protein [Maricaulaceae bacterium]